MTSVCNAMLLKNFHNKFSFLASTYNNFKIGILNFSKQNLMAILQNMEIFESPCINTWRLKTLRGLNTEIFESPYLNTREIQKSPCFKTWRFCKPKLFIFSNLCFNTQRVKNLCIKHRKISMFSNMEIKTLPWRFFL